MFSYYAPWTWNKLQNLDLNIYLLVNLKASCGSEKVNVFLENPQMLNIMGMCV